VAAPLHCDDCRSAEKGYALVFVIWGLALISLIALTVIMAERFRLLAAGNVVENAKLEALAEGAINRIRLELAWAGKLRFVINGRPLLCTMQNDVLAALSIEDEGGKVDLNTAPERLTSSLLRGFGADFDEADRLAARITEFSHPSPSVLLDEAAFRDYAADGRRFGPKKGPFETILELDQVVGFRRELLRAIFPYITVHSRQQGIDPRVASPALLAALAGDSPPPAVLVPDTFGETSSQFVAPRGIPSEFLTQSPGHSFLITAEVRAPTGSKFARSTIIELLLARDPPDVLREWRSGDSRFAALLNTIANRFPSERHLTSCWDDMR
jgi:general secretion pathway protein K